MRFSSALLSLLLVRAQQLPLKPCAPTNTSTGHSACYSDEACCSGMYFGAPGCEVKTPSAGTVCCAPGAALPVSSTLPNVLIIGDSVSDQYTPSVAARLNATALVQHAPYVGGGSANDVANGLFNLINCRWLRTALRPDQAVPWDLVAFNFVLHDLLNVFPDKLPIYTATLANVTDILLASGAKRVMYILGTPYMADDLPACGPYCDVPPAAAAAPLGDWPQPTGGNGRCGPPTHAVTVLNTAAQAVMAARSVPVFDLNSVVHAHCGATYDSCFMCDNETQYMGIECGYHYSPAGVEILADAVAGAVTAALGAPARSS